MKKITVIVLFLLYCYTTWAQSPQSLLEKYSDSLAVLGKNFINNPDDMERKNANYQFIRTLVKALKLPNSFHFKFDKVKSISILSAPDNKFRIFSWSIVNNDGSYRFYGTIQMNTSNGTLLMYPLEDYSPFLKNPQDTIADNHKWLGAQYYKIIVQPGTKTRYILLGWKGNNIVSTKKVIEVLTFENNKPVFGAPIFIHKNKTYNRVVFEYARQASMLLNYAEKNQIIVFDHLSAPDKQSIDKPETYGPDLTYDGYKLTNGKWQLIENMDMRNVGTNTDTEYQDPKQEAIKARNQIQNQ